MKVFHSFFRLKKDKKYKFFFFLQPKYPQSLQNYTKFVTIAVRYCYSLLLGNVSLQTQDKGKTYRLKFQQSENLHREYIFHLYDIFNEWSLSSLFL